MGDNQLFFMGNVTNNTLIVIVPPSGGGGLPVGPLQFSIKIVPHLYLNGEEIDDLNATYYDGISLDILGTNLQNHDITNLSIKDYAPSEFLDLMPNNTVTLFKNSTDQLLFSTRIFYFGTFNPDSNFIVSISCQGYFYQYKLFASAAYNLRYINRHFVYLIGKNVYPSNPKYGFYLILGLVLLIFVLLLMLTKKHIKNTWFFILGKKRKKKEEEKEEAEKWEAN